MIEKYFAYDRPIDYSEYLKMSKKEIEAEIAKLEAEAKREKDRILEGKKAV